jgi:ankyrin repeat protein
MLMAALDKSDPDIIKCLLDHGGDPNHTFDQGFHARDMVFPLQLAVRKQNLVVAKVLLEHGAKLDKTTYKEIDDGYHYTGFELEFSNWTVLHEAARNGGEEMMRFLIENDPGRLSYQKTGEGRSAIHVASEYRHTKCVEILLEHGFDINEMSKSKSTPLHFAVDYLRVETVKMLIGKVAITSLSNDAGLTPLEVARVKGHLGFWRPDEEKRGEIIRILSGCESSF